jgi:hypothetical protein
MRQRHLIQSQVVNNDHEVAVAGVFVSVSVFVPSVFRVFSVPVSVFSVFFVETTTLVTNISYILNLTLVLLNFETGQKH